jgi:hypothetical protein
MLAKVSMLVSKMKVKVSALSVRGSVVLAKVMSYGSR